MKTTRRRSIYLEGGCVPTAKEIADNESESCMHGITQSYFTNGKTAKDYAFDPDKIKKYDVIVTVEVRRAKNGG